MSVLSNVTFLGDDGARTLARDLEAQRGAPRDVLDWPAIASILAEQGQRPLVCLDQAGRVRLVNTAMERVLGWSRFEVEDREWASVCAPPDQRPEARRWTREGLRGALKTYRVMAQTKAGVRVELQVEFALIGRGSNQGLLMTVMQVQLAQVGGATLPPRDLEYEISTAGAEFGTLVGLSSGGAPRMLADESNRCHRVIHGRQSPCEDCPVLKASDEPWPRTLIRHHAEAGAGRGPGRFEIVEAEPVGPKLVRLRVRSISDGMLGAIQRAKMERLAAVAQLSQRECEVFDCLLLGRSIEDIAKVLGISTRTVKHHQANVLEKLGADSRADLLRLVL